MEPDPVNPRLVVWTVKRAGDDWLKGMLPLDVLQDIVYPHPHAILRICVHVRFRLHFQISITGAKFKVRYSKYVN